jgi:HEAT repeats
METNKIEELVLKYNEGLADPAEIRLLEKLIEDGAVDLTRLRALDKLDEQIVKAEGPLPSLTLDDQFYTMLAQEKRKLNKPAFSFSIPGFESLFPRLAFGFVVILAAFGGGYLLNKPANNSEVKELSQQVGDLKEMVMLSLLEKESASERLRAVSLSNEMDQASKKVTTALLKTLNQDNNVNVRLAALDALKSYIGDNQVRTELIRSIGKQDSPMVQVALAELMAAIQEKKSLKEFEKLLKGDKVPQDVKKRIKENIQVLI